MRSPRASSLPLLPPNIVGRDEAIRQVASQLLEYRFVSIVCLGGIGKTTVAAAIVEAKAAEFDDVHFLDLRPLNEPGLVASSLRRRSVFRRCQKHLAAISLSDFGAEILRIHTFNSGTAVDVQAAPALAGDGTSFSRYFDLVRPRPGSLGGRSHEA
jgi:hypothetical protein